MERSYSADNARELERLRALVSKLSDQDLGSMVNEYWTVAGVLGHMAFWDGRALFLAGKLQRALAGVAAGAFLLTFALELVRKGMTGDHGMSTAIGGKLLFIAAAAGVVTSIVAAVKPEA